DLRTPLTRMRGRLEKAYHRQQNSNYDHALIGDTMADLDAVLRMFSSLTRISQIETGDRTSAFRTVNLADIAGEVVELFDAAAEDKRVHLDAVVDRRILVTGDRGLLFDAVANLVDNAIKYGGEGGRVAVEVARNDGGAVIAVVDDGPGIPDDECQHVFKRFYRLERSRHTPGNGLGLSLVAAVARLHGARIEMVDNRPGLKCLLRFPSPAMSLTSPLGRVAPFCLDALRVHRRMSATKTRTAPVLRIVSLAQPREPPVREHAQGDRRREPDADGERLLERRMPRVERRHEKHAQQRRDAKVVPEGRGHPHL